MQYKKAIIVLNRFKSKTELSKDVSNAIDLAIREFEKRLDAKPNHIWINEVSRFNCPYCGCIVDSFTPVCECGQVLDWSEWK